MSEPRFLVVSADDFGRTAAVNEGIMTAHTQGIVTSTSLMVHGRAAGEAVALARQAPSLAVGLHVELTDWSVDGGEWVEQVRRADPDDAEAVRAELDRQLDAFVALVGRPPTHLDSHQHVHRGDAALPVFLAAAAALDVPLRGVSVAYTGSFYGQFGRAEPCHEHIGVEALRRLIEGLPAGVTEAGCHPGTWPDPHADGYGVERAIELRSLCDPSVRATISTAGVTLVGFDRLDHRGRVR